MTTIVSIANAKSRTAARLGARRRAAGQSRHAGHRRRPGRARLSEGISVRSARDRGPGAALEAHPQRHHPAQPAPHQGARLPQDLERREERVAAQDDHPRAGRKARARDRRPRSRRGRLGDALRQSVDPRRHRRLDGAGLRPHPRGAALSAIFGGDLGDRLRRGVSRAGKPARAADPAGEPALLRRSDLYRRAGGVDRGASGDPAVQARTDRGVLSRHAAGLCRQGRSL